MLKLRTEVAKNTMETEHLQNVESLVSDTTNSLKPRDENELTQSSEKKSNTKSILESIISDFQNIEVYSPNDRLSKTLELPGNSSVINDSRHPNINKGAGHSKASENPISNHTTNQVNVIPVQDSSLQTVNTAMNIKAALQQCGIQKPVSSDDNIANDKIVSSSLAELADAEIVQTDDNLVSIIITNPRLIQVLNSEDGQQQYSSLPQTSSAVPQVQNLTESVIVEPSPVSQQNLAFQSEIGEVADEIVYDGHMPEKCSKKKKFQFSSTPKGKTKAANFKQKTDSGKVTKARRISAKMKAEWAKTLAKKGSLVCPMQGCYQKYVTIANFVTHYKFCAGQTELKHCPYCSSLIFSDNKAMLHHMEVEHPEKVEEFKANVSDDESSSQYDEEEIPETPIQTEKRKISFLSKENQSPKGRKHKIFKSIAHETEIENIKEFRKCVRFDNIVSKINSCDQVDTPDELETSIQPSNSKSPKERKRKLVLTGKIVEEEKYFEDADDFLIEPKEENDNLKLNTKSRLVLNLERYKQFNQHLKLTRDWSSARKTYSRSRISDSSLDSSFTSVQTIGSCPTDDHQLDDLCLKSTNGENDSEVLYYANLPKELSEFDLESPTAVQKTRPSLISKTNSERKRVGILKEKIENTKEIEIEISPKPSMYISPNPEKPQNGFVLKEKKVPCYLRDTIANSTPKSATDSARKQTTKIGTVITYGKNIPSTEGKTIKAEKSPVIDFDTLFKNSMKEMKLLREKSKPVENAIEVKHLKQNGIKEPVVEKRKRGRPKKNKVLSEEEQTTLNMNTKDGENDSKVLYYANLPKELSEFDLKSPIAINREENIKTEAYNIRAKQLKNSQARAYIKSKRQRSIRNLNSKRSNQSHILVLQNPPTTLTEDIKTKEDTVNNILMKPNENQVHNLQDERMLESKIQNLSSPTVKNRESKLQANELHQNLGSIPDASAVLSQHETKKPNEQETHLNQKIDIENSIHFELKDVASNLNNINSDTKSKTEILKSVTDNTDDKPSCVQPVAQEKCSIETVIVPIIPCEKAIAKENVQSPNDNQTLNITEPVKRRRGRPKKIVPELNLKLPTVAISTDSLHLEIVQSKTVLSETVQADAVSSGAAQSDVVLSGVAQSNAVLCEAALSTDLPAEAVSSAAVSSSAASSSATSSSATSSSVVSSVAVQPDVASAENVLSTTVHSETILSVAVHSEVVSPEAVLSEGVSSATAQLEVVPSEGVSSATAQPGTVQSDAEMLDVAVSVSTQRGTKESLTVLPDSGQSVTEQPGMGQPANLQGTTEPSNVQSKQPMSDSVPSDVPLRKSLRLRNRNSSHSNSDFVFPTTKKESTSFVGSEELPPPVKAKRRGRPRKYPLTSDLNSSDLNTSAGEHSFQENLNSSVDEHSLKNDLNVSISESDNRNSVKESTEQYPNTSIPALPERRGRPRKYPLKRNLNSSASESDTLTDSKEQSTLPVRKRGRPRLHPLKSDLCPPTSLNNSLNESNTSLPALRKCPRKSRPVKCVHFEALNSHSSPPEEVVQEKKIETNLDSSRVETVDTLSTVKSKSSSDNSKPEKFILPPKKRKISGEEENITLSKEKSKDPDYVESEELSDDEGEVDQSRKSKKRVDDKLYTPEKRLKKKSKKSHSPSLKRVGITSTKPSFQFLSKFAGTVYDEIELYSNLKPVQNLFTTLTDEELQEFLPPMPSISIRIDTKEKESNWMKLKCFESLNTETLKYQTFFVGGPVSTSAFCPTPRNKICDQYIAVASSYNFLNMSYSSTNSSKGLIQIYNLGDLQNIKPPVLELALCHKTATITDMQWCPRGCYQEPPILSNNDVLPRLGLLAVASADSFVRIYSMPHPKFLTAIKESKNNSLPFFNSSPSIILEPMCGATRSSIATSLTWANTDLCEQIAVGYGNGMIGVWLINMTNSILLSNESALVKTIMPYLVFQAHGTPVTSLQFAPLQNCRYLVSSGFDKTLKFFDLVDTSIPFCSTKRGCAISCQWSSSLCGAFVSLHDGITYKGSNYFKDAGTEEFPTQTISGSISSLTQSSVSDAKNILATADIRGDVSVKLVAKSTLCGTEPGRLPPLNTYKLFKAEVASFESTIKRDMKEIMNSISHIKDVVDVSTDLTTQVEKYLISESDKALESSVSEVMDDLLMITDENNSKLNESSDAQLMDSNIEEADVLNLLVYLCEATVHSMNSVVEEDSKEELKSELVVESSKLGGNVSLSNDNVDSQMETFEIDDKLTIAVAKGSFNIGTTTMDIVEISDNLEKDSESPLIHVVPAVQCHVQEIFPPDHPKLEVDSSAVNSFISKNDSEAVGAIIDMCTNSTKNVQDNDETVSPSPSNEYEFDSQEMSQTLLSDDDSFSSEDVDSDKESDIAPDQELNFSDDSMMSECSLSSKSSESSYSSDNAMDESVSIDYIQDIESMCSPIPPDTSLIENRIETSESKCHPASNDSDLTEDCTQIPESMSNPTLNDSSLTNDCTQNSKSQCNVTSSDSPLTEDCIETSESRCDPAIVDLSLAEDCSASSETKCCSLPNDPTMTKVDTSSSPELTINSELVGMSDSQETSLSSSLPSTLKESVEISNSGLTESDSTSNATEVCIPTECGFVEKNIPSKSHESKNLEPSIQQFYKQQTRTSKPYMQAFKSATEASVNNVEIENSLGETMADREKEACVDQSRSYESIVSSHGIIFKDLHLGDNAECAAANGEDMDKLPPLEQNNFSSINTISWNPNHGYEYWLFSAGNSGIARLCCVSEISVPDGISRRQDT